MKRAENKKKNSVVYGKAAALIPNPRP